MNGNRVLAADGPGLAAAAAALRAGGVMGFPTDTVYGMAASVEIPEAVRAISLLKGRPVSQPLILMVAEIGEVDRYALVSPFAGRIAARHWPGALTLILPALEPAFVLGGGPTVGVRIPAHPIALALLRQGGPLATTSANRHGQPEATTAAEVARTFGEGLALVLDSGPCTGAPSTVVDCTGAEPKCLREGRIPWAEVLAAL
jgi:L-threonylcarbamoyladenylate synthase